jgi:hypothetical protein
MDLVIDYTITGSSVVIRYYKGGHKTISLEWIMFFYKFL